jgi:hypothetical protein
MAETKTCRKKNYKPVIKEPKKETVGIGLNVHINVLIKNGL